MHLLFEYTGEPTGLVRIRAFRLAALLALGKTPLLEFVSASVDEFLNQQGIFEQIL